MTGFVITLFIVIVSVFVPLLSLRLAKFLCEKYDWEIFFIQKICCLMGLHWKIEQVGFDKLRSLSKCRGCDKMGHIDEYGEFRQKN
jgi:hypothetical protein